MQLKDYTLICPTCGVSFTPWRIHQKFHTSKCREKYHYLLNLKGTKLAKIRELQERNLKMRQEILEKDQMT